MKSNRLEGARLKPVELLSVEAEQLMQEVVVLEAEDQVSICNVG